MYTAVRAGHVGATTALLSAGADPNLAKKSGLTPLCAACKSGGDSALALALLDAGADAELCPHDGCSPLFLASAAGKTDVVR